MRILHRLAPRAPLQIRMDHFPDDRPGPDNRHLHDNVVKPRRPQPRQAGHLRAALDLKHAHRVGLLQRLVNHRIIRGQPRQIHVFSIMVVDDLDRFFEHRHHPQAEQIHFDDAHVGAIFLVPLHHDAPRHRRRLERHHGIELPLANHHPARMLAQMARKILHANRKARGIS